MATLVVYPDHLLLVNGTDSLLLNTASDTLGLVAGSIASVELRAKAKILHMKDGQREVR